MSISSQKILGFDPGYGRTGFGVVEFSGSRLKCLNYGIIESPKEQEFNLRLKFLFKEAQRIIKKEKPDLIAVEELFFSKNVTTGIKVAEARGVILLAATLADLPVAEYKPNQIKQAISSYGRADKKQIQLIIKNILGLKEIPKPDDVADALALAVCAAGTYRFNKLCAKKI